MEYEEPDMDEYEDDSMEGTWELADEMMEYGALCDMEDW